MAVWRAYLSEKSWFMPDCAENCCTICAWISGAGVGPADVLGRVEICGELPCMGLGDGVGAGALKEFCNTTQHVDITKLRITNIYPFMPVMQN